MSGTFKVLIKIERDGEGFHAYCSALKGLHVYGESIEETCELAKEAVEVYLLSLIKHNEPIPIGEQEKSGRGAHKVVYSHHFQGNQCEDYIYATV